MYSLKIIKVNGSTICYLIQENKGFWWHGSGVGENAFQAVWELVKHCWRYNKMKKLLRVRKVIK